MRGSAVLDSRLARLVIVVTLLLGVVPSTAWAQVEPTRKQSCALPDSLKGVSGHVLVRYSVDIKGHVNFVKPTFVVVDPAEQQTAVVASVQDCLKQWRYPPMAEAPSWGHASVEALQAFHYFRPAPPGSETISLPDGRSIPRVHLDEMDDLRLSLAEQLLAGSAYAEERGLGWTLRSNVRRFDREAMVKAIRFTETAFDEVFPGRTPLSNEHAATVFLFDSQDAFNQVAAFDRILRGPMPAGQYSPADATAYTFLSKQEQPLRLSTDIVVHEFTHHLVHRRLAAPGRKVPYWVDEGIASLLQLLRAPKDGRVDLTGFERGDQAQGSFRWVAPATRYLKAIEGLEKTNEWPDFGRFLRGEFDSLTAEQSYGLSWALVHYLLHGEGGALRQSFVGWVTGSMGAPDDPGIAAALGRTPEQIPDVLAAYARSLK